MNKPVHSHWTLKKSFQIAQFIFTRESKGDFVVTIQKGVSMNLILVCTEIGRWARSFCKNDPLETHKHQEFAWRIYNCIERCLILIWRIVMLIICSIQCVGAENGLYLCIHSFPLPSGAFILPGFDWWPKNDNFGIQWHSDRVVCSSLILNWCAIILQDKFKDMSIYLFLREPFSKGVVIPGEG